MKKEILLQEKFVYWLSTIKKYPLPTANSYCDYIAAANRLLEIYKNESNEKSSLFAVLEVEVNMGNSDRMEEIIDEVTEELSEDKIEIKLKKSLKYIQNWKSALYQYKEFLHDYIEDEIITDEVTEDDDAAKQNAASSEPEKPVRNILLGKSHHTGDQKCANIKYVHSKSDLYARFHFRIITQDRHYDEIYYPISFIKRFLYLKNERNFMDTWVKELLNQVIIHVEGGTITLNQVSNLEIANGEVRVDLNGIFKVALTKKSDNITSMPFSVEKLRWIALDHETSLQKIMRENLNNLKTFQEITVELKKHNSPKMTSKEHKKVNNIVLESDYIDRINIENLKAEMALISSLTKLQLMDSIENTKKGQS